MTPTILTDINQLPAQWNYCEIVATTLDLALAEIKRARPWFAPQAVYQYGVRFFFPVDWRR
jgi:hypothetical protein